MPISRLTGNNRTEVPVVDGDGNGTSTRESKMPSRSGLRRMPELFARLGEQKAPRLESTPGKAAVSVTRPRATLTAQPTRLATEQEDCLSHFEEWSNSLPKSGSKAKRFATQVSEKFRHKPTLEEGELFFVTRFSEGEQSGHVIRDQFTPTRHQLKSGQLLIDGGNDEDKPRWYFYAHNGHPFAPADHARPGKLMMMDAQGSTLAHENFTPSRAELESGKYWLDSHEGADTWYRLDDPASVFPHAGIDPQARLD